MSMPSGLFVRNWNVLTLNSEWVKMIMILSICDEINTTRLYYDCIISKSSLSLTIQINDINRKYLLLKSDHWLSQSSVKHQAETRQPKQL